jgi:glycosyltransferase involved in cell wall biosynthesis
LNTNQVLIIGAVWVEPNSSAAGSRMFQIMELFLKNDYQVTFATTTQKSTNALNLKSIGVEEVSIKLNDASFDEFVKKLNPQIVIFDRFMIEEQFGWRVAENCPNALRILDTEDLHSLRKVRHEAVKKERDFTTNDLLNSDIAKREIASILRCDLSLIISTFEMDLLKNIFKIDSDILYHLPFLFDAVRASKVNLWKPFEERNHFITIGNFLHAPNLDAVLQLKKHIWPKIRKELPKAELHIYGAYPSEQVLQLHKPKEGFIVNGFIEDANKVVSEAKIVLAPIRFGAGIKGKLTEAMLNGAPSITTSIGAEGMHNDLPWNGFIEDDFEQFAMKAVQLYTNKENWKQSQLNGVEIINNLYSKKELSLMFIQKIEYLLSNIKRHRENNFLGSLLQHHSLQSTKYMSKWIEEKNKN